MTVEMEMARHRRSQACPFHRSRIRSDERLTYGEVDEIFAGRARAEEPWADALAARARGGARARATRRDALEVGIARADASSSTPTAT